MQKEQIQLKDTGYFSSIFLDYLEEKKELQSFYNFPYKKESFQKLNFSFSSEKRKVLVDELKNQYKNTPTTALVEENIESLLQENTYTVTTGHQLNIFTGPLFFVYKILQTIGLAEELNAENKEKKFVPVFWMASEDHDFDEIKSVSIFGKDYNWESLQKGAVGRFKIDDSFKALLEELPEELKSITEFYLQSENLAEATRKLVNALFQNYGLVILDADNKALKAEFKPQLKQEVVVRSTNDLVEQESSKLEVLGYKTQIFPRTINLFYLDESGRNRIVFSEEGTYEVLSTNLKFTEEEILAEIDNNPDKFSPNVVLRPIYQQVILPNIAYCGGPAEIAYWLQLKTAFDFHKAVFPILVPRAYGLIMPANLKKKLDKLGLETEELFRKEQVFERVFKESKSGIDFSFSDEKRLLNEILESYKGKASGIGNAAVAKVVRSFKEMGKSFHSIEREIKKSHETAIEEELGRALNIKQKLFPNDGLQERSENIFSFLINDPEIINKLHEEIKPFEVKFNVFIS